MRDFYLNRDNVTNRLIREWKEHGKLVIAYDFDNTVFDYHGEGHTYDDVVALLRRCKRVGAHFIVFTAAAPERHSEIIKYLHEHDIPFDYINENVPELPFGNNGKVYYNILLDDRAGLDSAYASLRDACTTLRLEKWTDYLAQLGEKQEETQ